LEDHDFEHERVRPGKFRCIKSWNGLQGTGEVHSLNRANDMGISDISSLLWMRQDNIWQPWGSWVVSRVDNPPYWITGNPNDPNAYMRVGGNQGNPVPPDAPCP
jgi:hypothetical protein